MHSGLMRKVLTLGIITGVVILAGFSSVFAEANDTTKGYVDPALGVSPETIELLSGVVYKYLIETGRYIPAGKTWSEAVREIRGSSVPVPRDLPFSPNVRLNDVTTDSQNEVSMASDTKGNLVAGWNDNRAGNSYKCAFTSSQDGGKTWSPNELYAPPGNQGGDPVVVTDVDGNFYRLCMGFGGSQWVFAVSKSTDGGKTWGQWHTVNGDDKPWLAAYKGKLYITYMSSANQIELLRSYDDGQTWLPSKPIGQVQGSCIVVDAQGRLYASWGLNTIQFSKSTDSGDTWTPAKNLGPGSGIHGTPRSASLTGCAVTPDGKDVYVIWSGDGSVDNVYVASSHDGGDTWSSPVKVNDNTGNSREILPWIAVDGKGVVHAIWVSNRNGGGETYYSNSTDGGATWSQNIRVSDVQPKAWVNFIGDYNAVTVTPKGDVAAAWCDNRDGTADIWFSSAPLGTGGGGGQVLTRIEVTPSNPTITADQTQQFTAIGYDQNNQQMTINPTWSTTGGSIDANGLYTPDKVGTYMVTAAQGKVSGSTNITVTAGAPAKIAVTPKSATITADETQQFNASVTDAKGNPVQVTPTWSTNGGTISASGLYTPSKVGTYTVTAAHGSISDTASITVTPGKPVKMKVEPSEARITADDTQQFNASVTDAKDNPVSVVVTWSVNGGSIDSKGLYTPDKVGTYTITASSGGLSATAEVTVTHGKLASILIVPVNATLQEGEKVKFSVKNATDAKGNEIPMSELTVTWSSGNTSIGTITQTGEFTAVSAGTTTVTASVTDGKATKSVSASVVVKAKPKGPEDIISGSSMMLWLLLILIIVVVAIIVALVVMKRRKKPQPMPEYGFYPQYAPGPEGYQQPYPGPQQPYPGQPMPTYPEPGYPPQSGSYPPSYPP